MFNECLALSFSPPESFVVFVFGLYPLFWHTLLVFVRSNFSITNNKKERLTQKMKWAGRETFVLFLFTWPCDC